MSSHHVYPIACDYPDCEERIDGIVNFRVTRQWARIRHRWQVMVLRALPHGSQWVDLCLQHSSEPGSARDRATRKLIIEQRRKSL